MPIASIGYPLVIKVDKKAIDLADIANEVGTTAIRVTVRALEGMQKEAIVQYGLSRMWAAQRTYWKSKSLFNSLL